MASIMLVIVVMPMVVMVVVVVVQDAPNLGSGMQEAPECMPLVMVRGSLCSKLLLLPFLGAMLVFHGVAVTDQAHGEGHVVDWRAP